MIAQMWRRFVGMEPTRTRRSELRRLGRVRSDEVRGIPIDSPHGKGMPLSDDLLRRLNERGK